MFLNEQNHLKTNERPNTRPETRRKQQKCFKALVKAIIYMYRGKCSVSLVREMQIETIFKKNTTAIIRTKNMLVKMKRELITLLRM